MLKPLRRRQKYISSFARDWRRAAGPQAKWKRPARIVPAVGASAPPNTSLQIHVEERAGVDPQRDPPPHLRAHYRVNSRHCKRATVSASSATKRCQRPAVWARRATVTDDTREGPRSAVNRTSKEVSSRQPQNAPVRRVAPASTRQRTSTAGPDASSLATTSGYGAFSVSKTARRRPFDVAATT